MFVNAGARWANIEKKPPRPTPAAGCRSARNLPKKKNI
jgi:hypothetical protein